MKHISALLPFCFVLCAANAAAQNPPKEQRPEQSEDVVRVTTNLVQLDAIVTDKSGRPVANLRPEDFELLENGHARQISQFSYISFTTKEAASDTPNMSQVGKSLPPTTTGPIRSEQGRRVIAILIDDFGLSFESTANVRSALEKFIGEQTLPDDLVSVIRASGGPGSIQQFTADRQQLLATIKGLRWYATGRGKMSAVDSIEPVNSDADGIPLRGYQNNNQLDVSGREFFHGTLGALGFVVQKLGRVPGRKSIVLISDNLSVTGKEAQANGVTSALDKLIELANRQSVVVYTMDPRGITPQGIHADDNQYNLALNQLEMRQRARPMQFRVEQDGLSYLARHTGGLFIHDTNDLSDGLRRVLDEEQGYYLIAYRPDDLESDPARGRTYRVTLRLKLPGLEVRTRSGFHRLEATGARNDVPRTKDESLRDALASPFVSDAVHLKMTALFTGGSQVKILLHVEARDIEFTRSAEQAYIGSFIGSFDVAAVAFDLNGKVAQQVVRNQTLRVPPSAYERFLHEGFAYTITIPIAIPGAYQMRLALRDGVSGRVGSGSQLVEVPDINKKRLVVTGLIVQGVAQDAAKGRPVETSSLLETKTNEGRERGRDSLVTGPAERRFTGGDILGYSYLIYGARRDGATHSLNLLSQIRLLHMGKEVFTGSTLPVALAQEQVGDGVIAGGSFRLGTGLPAGEYFLQLTVTDTLAPSDRQASDQWIDFVIEKT